MKSFDLIKPYFHENRMVIAYGMISLIIVDLLQLFIPRIIKWAVDDLTSGQTDIAGLLRYAAAIVAVALLIGLFRFVWRYCLLGTSRRVEEGIRSKLFSHLQTLSASYYDQTRTGDLMAHATNDIQQVRMAAGMGLVALNDAVVLGLAAIGFMAYIDVPLTLLVLIPMPFIALAARYFSRKMHHRYQQVQSSFAELTEAVRERIAGIRVIKSYGLERGEADRVNGFSQRYVRENLGLVKITGTFFPMMLLLTNLSLAIVIFFGGRQTIRGTITTGDFVAFISYLGLLTWPMMALGWVTNLIQRGRASLDRLNAVLQSRAHVVSRSSAQPLPTASREISLENVSFAYNGLQRSDSRPVLNSINLQVPAGTFLGIVGPPGSGKTTLLNLLPRLYDTAGGRILLDGHDIRDIRLPNLRSHMAFVPQEPFLFAGSIRQNLTLDDPAITQTTLKEAVAGAALDETIRSMPKGLETIVGEKGIVLSGGQKQRIALARALLTPAAIFLLDDPISQVDLETGTRIINTLHSMAGNRTIIIVSHRMSAVRHADRIITLEDGRIVETGNHSELMAGNRYYARTYRLQEIEEGWHAN
jgi:ATP-binding cassette subfamily B protein